MDKIIPTLLLLGTVAVIFTLMWRGWRKQIHAQNHVPAPKRIPEALDPSLTEESAGVPYEGTYVCTTRADKPLERISVHELGLRTPAWLLPIPQGIVCFRQGVEDFFIPRSDITDYGSSSGMIGKFVERDGLVLIRWWLGTTQVDTGFRTRYAADRSALIDHLSTLYTSAERRD